MLELIKNELVGREMSMNEIEAVTTERFGAYAELDASDDAIKDIIESGCINYTIIPNEDDDFVNDERYLIDFEIISNSEEDEWIGRTIVKIIDVSNN